MDALDKVFTSEVRSRLEAVQNPTQELQFRRDVLQACGPLPEDRNTAELIGKFRAWKAAWDVYLQAAFRCGMFDGLDGGGLRSRLTGRSGEGFRSAMAECLACWYCAAVMGRSVTPWPAGRDGRKLDLLVGLPSGDMRLEVKAPRREIADEGSWGLADDLFSEGLKDAGRKFEEGQRNVLVLVPDVKPRVSELPVQLVNALYGQDWILCPIDPGTGESTGPPEIKFKPDGKLLKPLRKVKSTLESDLAPGFTRVSAVVSIEERLVVRMNSYLVTHDILVFHNPNAAEPVPAEVWKDSRQYSIAKR